MSCLLPASTFAHGAAVAAGLFPHLMVNTGASYTDGKAGFAPGATLGYGILAAGGRGLGGFYFKTDYSYDTGYQHSRWRIGPEVFATPYMADVTLLIASRGGVGASVKVGYALYDNFPLVWFYLSAGVTGSLWFAEAGISAGI